MTSRFKIAIVPILIAALAMLTLPVSSSDSYAHRAGRRHRHHHRARGVVVVSNPVIMPSPVIVAGRPHGVVDFNRMPRQTELFVDGVLRGNVDDFDGHPGKLRLAPGKHKIVLRTPDGELYKRRIRIVAGHELNLKLDFNE